MRVIQLSSVAFVVLLSGWSMTCNSAPEVPRSPSSVAEVPFPESVTVNRGLPPRFDSTLVILGDTVMQTSISGMAATDTSPMQFGVRVFVHDTSLSVLRARKLPLAACPVSLRLYRNGQTSPVWTSDRATTTARCPTVHSFDTSRTDVTGTWSVRQLLGDSLPNGRYRVAYSVHAADGRAFDFNGESAFLTTDRTQPTSDLSGVQFAAQSEIVGRGPRMLTAVAVLKNTAGHPISVSFGACNLNLRLYRNADRSGEPIWRSERRKIPGSPLGQVCVLVLYMATVRAGDSLAFPVSIPMYEVTADSFPAGRYYVEAELGLIDKSGRSRERVRPRLIAAGVVDITREPDPLPSSREIGGLTYAATTRLVHGAGGGDTVRTLVRVMNLTKERHTASVARDCPVTAYPYRTRALRDSVPLAVPLPYSSPSCRVNKHPFALNPGESWVFSRDVPLSEARELIGVGHVWFTAQLSGLYGATLAAGDIEIPSR